MKHSVLMMALLWGVITIATSASALTVGTIDVGDRDTFIASTHLSNSSDAAELAWVQSILGTSVVWDLKYDTDRVDWKSTNETGTYALQLLDNPEYFMIKTANGAFEHFLFANKTSLDWAVLNLAADFGAGYQIKNIGKFSHVIEFNGDPTTTVPEPSTLILLGAGLGALAIWRKKRTN